MKRCILPDCESTERDASISLHRFPANSFIRDRWLYSIRKVLGLLGYDLSDLKPQMEQGRICSKHFKPDCFTPFGTNRTRLDGTAVPTIFYDCSGNGFEIELDVIPFAEVTAESEEEPPKYCAVQGCGTQNNPETRGITWHIFPMDVEECKAWIRFANNKQANKQYIMFGPAGVRKWRMCSRHFDQNWFRFEKGKFCCLKQGAIPTLASPADKMSSVLLGQSSSHKIASTKPIEKRSATVSISKQKVRSLTDNNQLLPGFHKSQSQQTEDDNFKPAATPIPLRYQQSCRLCFTYENLEPLYSGLIVVRDEMLDRIYLCTGIIIVPKATESVYICTTCAETIDTFFKFRQQVSSNNLLYHEKRAADVAHKRAQNVARLRKARNIKRQNNNNTSTEVVAKIRHIAPEPLQVEFLEEDSVPKPLPESMPNPLDCEPEIKLEPDVCVIEADPIELAMTVEDDMELKSESPIILSDNLSEELPEEESWTCQHCNQIFVFKFEYAKHLLQKHRVTVEVIKTELSLDELNSNMLEMMNAKLEKPL
ncbi:uncharacterized protein LOC128743486 [Sabethes cyaneus]|uniref:uncharacterized protein LOC128743486 n=1 Tax=Sabethes cyaneus TaxID=53552 RepID=UPI00237DEC7B|nr:uncharacterized protein LOC128743486 [Sabethes cyaneus]